MPKIQVTVETKLDLSKLQQALDAINTIVKDNPSITNVEVTVHQNAQPAKPTNFFWQMIQSSPAPGVTIGKMLFFGLIALILFVFCIDYAIEKGDATVLFSFMLMLFIGFIFFFFDELHWMR